jgi:hypothetical protein
MLPRDRAWTDLRAAVGTVHLVLEEGMAIDLDTSTGIGQGHVRLV